MSSYSTFFFQLHCSHKKYTLVSHCCLSAGWSGLANKKNLQACVNSNWPIFVWSYEWGQCMLQGLERGFHFIIRLKKYTARVILCHDQPRSLGWSLTAQKVRARTASCNSNASRVHCMCAAETTESISTTPHTTYRNGKVLFNAIYLSNHMLLDRGASVCALFFP